jgi:hypothetical protein
VLNRPEPNDLAHIPEADTDLEIETGKPSNTEIYKAITFLKNNNAPGNDNEEVVVEQWSKIFGN